MKLGHGDRGQYCGRTLVGFQTNMPVLARAEPVITIAWSSCLPIYSTSTNIDTLKV